MSETTSKRMDNDLVFAFVTSPTQVTVQTTRAQHVSSLLLIIIMIECCLAAGPPLRGQRRQAEG